MSALTIEWFSVTRCLVVGWWLVTIASGLLADETETSAARSHPFAGLNTVGYLPSAVKQATLHGIPPGAEFMVRNAATGEEVLRGRASRSEHNEIADAQFSLADFSDVRQRGSYELVLGDVDDAARFTVADDVYNWPFYCVTRAMYLARCGTAVEGQYGPDTFRHAACHPADGHLNHSGEAKAGPRDATGGWHDAGDYNKYTINAAFTLGMMMQAWERFDDRLVNLKFDIPESNNGIPDYLDEIRWELQWLLKMQADDGRVYHKLSALNFNDNELPEEDHAPRFFSAWGSAATADFAAVMAQAARIFQSYDALFAERCLAAARRSYQYLDKHPEDHRPDLSAFSTGEYATSDRDDRLWAAAELWETTGEASFLRDAEVRLESFRRGNPAPPLVDSDWDWSNVRNLGTFTYLLSSRAGRDANRVAAIREDALRSADGIVSAARRHLHGRPLGTRYYWGSNGTVARLAINLEAAHRLTGEPEFRAAMLDALNYLFGRNPYGRSFVTGLGRRPPMFPHDRRSAGDKLRPPWPGYLVGGPWPTESDWRDVEDDYRTNEIAINWNGALIYALAAFVEPERFDASVATAQQSLTRVAADN